MPRAHKCHLARLSPLRFNQKRPQDYTYETPVYDPSVDEDGNLINPGDILYYQENYSGNKDSLGLNVGAALTFTFPLDQPISKCLLEKCYNSRKKYKLKYYLRKD